MKYLLINPITGDRRMPSYFPLGLAYIAQVLLDANHEVQVLDINAHRWTEQEVQQQLQGVDFDIAGITGMVTEFQSVRWLSQAVKETNPSATVILGGGLPTAFPQYVLEQTRADIAVVGEGEVTIKEIAERLATEASLQSVKGIWYKKGSELRETPPRPLVEDLDTLPLPARHLFPLDLYIRNPVSYLRLFDPNIVSTNIVSSRGCPYRCTYCFHGLWGSRFRALSPDRIITEMTHLKDKHGINGILFMDDTFVLNRKRVVSLCEKMIDQDLAMTWVASGRVNLVDPEILQVMRAAGCRAILYGIESGSQQILDEMCKGVTVAQARQAVLDTWEAGILPVGYLMIGMFSETRETVAETVRFCNDTGLVSGFGYATPFPGTELYTQAVERGIIQADTVGEMLEGWGAWNEEIIVNLSQFSDQELVSLKRSARIKIFWGKWWRKAWLYFRVLGLSNSLREVVRYILKAMQIGRYT